MSKAKKELEPTPEVQPMVEELQQELAEAVQVINEQAEALKKVAVEKQVQSPVVKIGGKNYKLTIRRFNFNGAVKTAKNINEEKGLGEELLKMGFGGLKEIK
jgi:glutaredoxin